MITRRRVNASLIRRRNSRLLTTIPVLLRLTRIRRLRLRMSKVAVIRTSISLVRVFLHLRTRRFRQHRLSSLSVHVPHLHIIHLCILLLAETAAVVPTGHCWQCILIVRLGRGIKVRILWFLLLLLAIHGCRGGLILSILRELRDGGRRLSVSLVTAMVVVAAGCAARKAGEAAAAAFKAAAEAAD